MGHLRVAASCTMTKMKKKLFEAERFTQYMSQGCNEKRNKIGHLQLQHPQQGQQVLMSVDHQPASKIQSGRRQPARKVQSGRRRQRKVQSGQRPLRKVHLLMTTALFMSKCWIKSITMTKMKTFFLWSRTVCAINVTALLPSYRLSLRNNILKQKSLKTIKILALILIFEHSNKNNLSNQLLSCLRSFS